MLRIARETDYAIVLMSKLARRGEDALASARDLSDESRLTPQMVSKILKRLGREGLLVSQRGVNGGYRLARESDTITVVDIIAAIEGPIALTACVADTTDDCAHEESCQVRGNWQLINRRILDSLSTITLREMAGSLNDDSIPGPGMAPLLRRPLPSGRRRP